MKNHETEIKLAMPDAAAARKKLRVAGFRIHKRRIFERNTIYDTKDAALRRQSRLIRIREAGGKNILTYKGTPKPGRHKSREECEVTVEDARQMAVILERLGYTPIFRYEKFRTEYQREGEQGIAKVDETPIGVFVELEGAPRWIDRTARDLEFSRADYNTQSYGSLYLEWCRKNNRRPGNMVFR